MSQYFFILWEILDNSRQRSILIEVMTVWNKKWCIISGWIITRETELQRSRVELVQSYGQSVIHLRQFSNSFNMFAFWDPTCHSYCRSPSSGPYLAKNGLGVFWLVLLNSNMVCVHKCIYILPAVGLCAGMLILLEIPRVSICQICVHHEQRHKPTLWVHQN